MESVPVWISDQSVTGRPSGNRSPILSYLFSCFSCMYLFIFLLLWISDWSVAGRPVPSLLWVIRREPYSSHSYTLTCLHLHSCNPHSHPHLISLFLLITRRKLSFKIQSFSMILIKVQSDVYWLPFCSALKK